MCWDPTRIVAFLVLVALATSLVPDQSALAIKDNPDCLRWRRAFADMPEGTLVVYASAAQPLRIRVKVARTDEARWAGFQCATPDEIRTTVIVFDFQREMFGAFHMRNVPAPLDIAFVKESGRILSVLRMEPSPTATYWPMGTYRHAIEARAGFFKERGVSPGDEVRLDPR